MINKEIIIVIIIIIIIIIMQRFMQRLVFKYCVDFNLLIIII